MVVPAPTASSAARPRRAELAGIDEIYRIGERRGGGARSRHGEIAPVDKIVVPGNAYVAAAKRRVFAWSGST